MTLNDFKFGDYQLGNNNFKNNKLTGVPNQVFTAGVYAAGLKNYYLNLNFNYTGSMPLNDANVVVAAPYRLWQGKAGWKGTLKGHVVDLFLLLDNMGNQQYSLGNDINAFGGRFFNAAPTRNFLFGCSVDF
jgi:iron complex outermembrane receptor protein